MLSVDDVNNKWARGLFSRSGGWLLNGGFEAFNCPVLIALISALVLFVLFSSASFVRVWRDTIYWEVE